MSLPQVNHVASRSVRTFTASERPFDEPDFVGQLGWQTDTQTMWVAIGVSAGDWQQVLATALNRKGLSPGVGSSGGAMRLIIPIPSDPGDRSLAIKVILAKDIHYTKIIKTIDASDPALTDDNQPVVNAWAHMHVFTGGVFTKNVDFGQLGPPFYQKTLVINLSPYLASLATSEAQKPIFYKYRWLNGVEGAESDWEGSVLGATPTLADEIPIIPMPPGVTLV